MAEQAHVPEKSFLRGLACAALSPGLRSVLLFDASPLGLRASVLTLAQMLTITTQKPVRVVQLSSADTEESLWGAFSLAPTDSGPVACWHPGVLVPTQGEHAVRLVLIPDLARLSLAARRACVALLGSNVASLDRHGHHEEWLPDMCWVAACAVSDMGQVTLHLRDRFALRIDARHLGQSTASVDDLLSWVDATHTGPRSVENTAPLIDWPGYNPPQNANSSIPTALVDQLRAAASRPWPDTAPDAIARVNEFMVKSDIYALRKEIILARLAVANARLQGAEHVISQHVDMAARMLNQHVSLPLPPNPQMPPPLGSDDQPSPKKHDKIADSQPRDANDTYIGEEPLGLDETEQIAPGTLAEHQDPVEQITVKHEWESLRIPPGLERPILASRGSVIGAEPSQSLHDIAVIATLLEAAKYQVIRRKHSGLTERKLLLSTTDIHRYRRAPAETRLLVLVIDYTSIGNSQWENALLLHLRWAYQKRAAICLVQVGASKVKMGESEDLADLRAAQIPEKNILSPRFGEALYAHPGSATPLAHGLDLALQTLKRNLHQGDAHIEEARLIVLTDGRGNVPLSASREGRIKGSVNREGIDDALMVAHQIAGLRHVRSLVLAPHPLFLAHLPVQLADALGAGFIRIPPDDTQFEETQVQE